MYLGSSGRTHHRHLREGAFDSVGWTHVSVENTHTNRVLNTFGHKTIISPSVNINKCELIAGQKRQFHYALSARGACMIKYHRLPFVESLCHECHLCFCMKWGMVCWQDKRSSPDNLSSG